MLAIKYFIIAAISVSLFDVSYGVPWQPEPVNNADWLRRHEQFVNRTREGNINVIFMGASITDWWPQDLFNENFAPFGAVNYGISGDGVEHALWRMINGELDGLQDTLKLIVFADCGSNSAGSYNAQDIAQGYVATIDAIRSRLPRTRILLMGLMPRDNGFQDRWIRLADVNIRNSKFDNGNPDSVVKYLDLWNQFSQTWGVVQPELFNDDQLHLTYAGYQMWAKLINPLFRSMIQ